jgi:Helix-turn-helix
MSWYHEAVPLADKRFDQHLEALRTQRQARNDTEAHDHDRDNERDVQHLGPGQGPRDPTEKEAGRTAATERREAHVCGHRLAEMRKAAGLTQAQVAEMLGVTQARGLQDRARRDGAALGSRTPDLRITRFAITDSTVLRHSIAARQPAHGAQSVSSIGRRFVP